MERCVSAAASGQPGWTTVEGETRYWNARMATDRAGHAALAIALPEPDRDWTLEVLALDRGGAVGYTEVSVAGAR